MDTQMIIRIDPDLKEKIAKYARAEGKSVSSVVRELLRDYVKNRDIGAYVDELWERIGGKLRTRGKTRKDIPASIKSVRAEK